MSNSGDRKTVWVAYTNTDLTEGRGWQVPLAVCELRSTALRLGKGKYVQGCDCPVKPTEMIMVSGKWYVPACAVRIVEPSAADRAAQAADKARIDAIEKARSAGLSDADIAIIAGEVTR